MFNFETIQNYLKKDASFEEDATKEMAKDILKKYECFNKLLNGKEDIFQTCKDIILKDLLATLRGNPSANRDYIIGYQDAVEVFLRNFNKFRDAHDVVFK